MPRTLRPAMALVGVVLVFVSLCGVVAWALTWRRAPATASRGTRAAPAAAADAGAAPAVGVVIDRRPAPAAAGIRHVTIPLVDHVPARLPVEGVPSGWELKEFAGRAAVELVRDDGKLALRLRSDRTSFVLYRDAVIDVAQFPMFSWSWKAMRLPDAGDVRVRATDDEAAQVYLVFPRWPSPRSQSDVIGYVWDTHAPVGTQVRSPKADNVRIVVLESGARRAGAWQREERDVREDYLALFGRTPPRLGKVAVMIDSNDTGGGAEALVAELAFARSRSEHMERPMSMLR